MTDICSRSFNFLYNYLNFLNITKLNNKNCCVLSLTMLEFKGTKQNVSRIYRFRTIYHYLALKKLKCFENDVLVVTRDKVIIDHLTSITKVIKINVKY